MAFRVEIVDRNDYRCGCCFRSWAGSEIQKDTIEEALAEFPTEFPKEGDYGGLHSITITDETTGEKVAWGEVTWPVGYSRTGQYALTRWSGFRPDQGAFEIIIEGAVGDVLQGSWEELLAVKFPKT